MLAERAERTKSTYQRTCEYRGRTYFVMIDMNGCGFIDVDGQKMYLDKSGRVANKQKGTKSVKTAIENFEDMKKIQDYFIRNENWNFYLLFTLNINTGRRISDLRNARWCDFFQKNGEVKMVWMIGEEQKTGKSKELFINTAIREAFRVYLEHEDIDFRHEYYDAIFIQRHGTHPGKVVSEEGYRKALIKAQECLDYEIRSHSMRRGMGKMMMELHPNDNKAKSVLMELYNHSSEKMTNKYIGETAKLEKEYLEDFGDKYKRYVMNGEDVPYAIRKPVSVYDNSELRNYMLCAFGRILDMKDERDPIVLMKLYNELLDGLEVIAK